MKYVFRYLVERDADFAIIGAFEKNQSVRKLFLEGFRKTDSKLVEVRHSYMQQEEEFGFGESDIIFIMEDDNGKFAIFIEDKIKANAQPSQSYRYDVRAKHLMSRKEFDDYRVFLCAPSFYINGDSKNVVGYKYRISYEEIVKLLPDCIEKSVLETAASGKSCSVIDSGVTNFWRDLRTFINSYYPNKLVMKGSDSNKPSGSVWQEFATPIKGCVIVMKIDSRKIDLEFKQMGQNIDALNKILADYGIKEKAIRTAKGRSKSASIQLEIPEEYGLSFYVPFYGQEQKASFWIESAIKLMEIVRLLQQHNITKFPF